MRAAPLKAARRFTIAKPKSEERNTMRLIFHYIRKHLGIFLLSTLFLTMEAMADLLQPTFMSYIVDEGVKNADVRQILFYGAIMLGIALFAIAGAVLYVWGLKKSVNQREDLQRSLLSACGSRVVRRAKKQGGITRAEIAALIEGLSVGPFWSRSRVRVQSGEKAADQVIAFLLGQQYLEAAGDDTYRVKK